MITDQELLAILVTMAGILVMVWTGRLGDRARFAYYCGMVATVFGLLTLIMKVMEGWG